MNILAIDTANSATSITVKKGQQYFSASKPGLHLQSELSLTLIDQTLQKAEIKLSELDCLAFSAGPASFTGIRLSLSVVQGLALPNNIPVVTVDSLHALAQEFYAIHQHPKIIVCTNAHMGQMFWATYVADEQGRLQVTQPAILLDAEFFLKLEGEGWVIVGNGWNIYKKQLEPLLKSHIIAIFEDFLPSSAVAVADLAEISFQAGEAQAAANVVPIYLRTAQAWKSSSFS